MSAYVLARIQAIQQELEALKKAVIHQDKASGRKTKLKGLWKGVRVSEEDLEEAQRVVFKDAYMFRG